jgi:propionyl-CoA carboxylase alpha chain
MNTRLQVEHPVTEQVTGLDLVEQMIRVAAGERLGFGQSAVKMIGWSVETRVYAEDPYRGFLPSTGRLVRYRPPAAAPGVRVDDGVAEGGEVSIFYDPMIAKLITTGATREAAIDRQVEALDAFRIEGIGHNVDFLSALMQHPRFRAGAITTGFIAEEYPEGFHGAPADAALLEDLALMAGMIGMEMDFQAGGVSDKLNGNVAPPEERVVRIAGNEYAVRFDGFEGGLIGYVDEGDGREVIGHWQPGGALFKARIDERTRIVQVARKGRQWRLTTRGASHLVEMLPKHVALLSRHMIEKVPPDLSRFLICPMPGLLTRLDVGAGDKVEAGQPLAVVEAMKMENILRAEKAGTVKSVNAKPGDSLAVDAVILEFE